MTDTDGRDVWLVDAFTRTALEGTPVAVLPDGGDLDAEQRRAVAGEFAGGSTAAVAPDPTGDADRRLDVGRPVDDTATVDPPRNDHAAVAAHAALFSAGAIEPGSHTVATPDGPRGVEVSPDGRAWVAQPDASVERVVDTTHRDVADALGCATEALAGLADDLPLAVAETVAPVLVVPVTYLQELGGAEPEPEPLGALCAAVDAAGVVPFTFDTVAGHALHCRQFVPDAGAAALGAQRPADGLESLPTGAGAGAVAAYLRAFGAFESAASDGGEPSDSADADGPEDGGADAGDDETDGDMDWEVREVTDLAGVPGGGDGTADGDGASALGGLTAAGADVDVDLGLPDEFAVECGHYLDRPGVVHVRTGTGIQVGGHAAVALEGRVAVPEPADDDITVA
ncbi:MAG: PhzF family phenazine biosynthesis protein [Halobacteriaceae archaeon]